MITPGDIAPRRDTGHEAYVVILSNSIHLSADTGRLVSCPFVPGRIPDAAMAMVVAVEQPEGVVLPELVQWLPTAALDEPIGNIGAQALRQTASLITALIT